MPLNLRASKQIKNFNIPVSYKIYDGRDRFIDARNGYSIQNRWETRFGMSRYNDTSLGGSILSLSFFTKSTGDRYCIAKVDTTLVSVATSGASTTIKSGLSSTTVHRGLTENNRHIIAVEGDGLFSWDGTTFSQLGQDAPATLTATIAAGGSLTDTDQYQAAITYYASSIGYESNYQSSGIVTAATPNLRVALTNIPGTAANAFIDKVRIYLKNVTNNGAFLFIAEINLGTTSYNVDNESTSSQTPPINNGAPLAGGGKYLSTFNSKLVYSGNTTYPNDVFFSEQYLPDAFDPNDTQIVLTISGQGAITGIATGLFYDSQLEPFLVIFKRKSTHVYSEQGGVSRLNTISNEIGCVSHNTIVLKNGAIYFLSEEGWRGIINGQFLKNRTGDEITLAEGDVDDIFKTSGYIYEVNRNKMSTTFSVYYPTLNQYLTWVAEGSNDAFTKTYNYQFDIGGFVPYEFYVPATCATLGENSSGRDIVLFGTSDGYILKHSILESISDVDSNNTAVDIAAFCVFPWLPGNGDYDATYNFRELIVRAINSSIGTTVKTWVNFNFSTTEELDYTFTNPSSGFILDESMLDVGVFGDDRSIVTMRNDINRVGESLAIGFYKTAQDSSLSLVSIQIDSSKNGNRN